MPLVPIKIPAGVTREPTDYANTGRYYNSDKIRFRFGYPQKIGGWAQASPYALAGIARAMHNWINLDGANYLAIGTSKKLYIEELEYPNDITPIRRTSTVSNCFTFTSGLSIITVTDTAHGSSVGDYVTVSGVPSDIYGIPVSEFNAEFVILTVPDANTYTIQVTTNANTTGTPAVSNVTFAYQISIGYDIASTSYGWGMGGWGSSGWGETYSTISNIRLWSLDNYGEDLVANYRDGPIYYWDRSLGLSSRAVDLTTLGGASDVPTIAVAVTVTDDRHTVAFGCNALGTSTQDKLLVRWSDQEDPTQWTPAATNTAGDYRLSAGSYIVGVKKTRQETLIWTDAALYSMQFIGPPYTFRFNLIATNISIASPNAMSAIGDVVYWMGINTFYMYSGSVKKIPCPVHSYVFSDLSSLQLTQTHSGTNEKFDEVWWFYPSTNASYPDKYLIYNYVENHWAIGSMTRTCWLDLKTRQYPVATNTTNLLYHEYGNDDDATGTPAAITAYVETSVFELDAGNKVSFVKRVMPDVSYEGSDAASPVVNLTIAVRGYPGQAQYDTAAVAVTRTATVPIEQYTNQVWIRLRGREVSLKFSSDALGVAWQAGLVRLEIQGDGKR